MSQKVNSQDTIHCNRCNEAFEAPKEMDRDGFHGQQAARIHDFCTCPHCQQTDAHWVFASDLIPTFEGNFESQKRQKKNWLNNN